MPRERSTGRPDGVPSDDTDDESAWQGRSEVKCKSSGLIVDIPARVLVASLRTTTDERIGRFELCESDGVRAHRWEWLGERWPARPFLMRPDAEEHAPTPALSAHLPLPGRIQRPLRGAYIGPEGDCQRLYDVFRIDGVQRQLAVLAVHGERLRWYELGTGGVLEVAPAWLLFVPRETPVSARIVTRCILQEVGLAQDR